MFENINLSKRMGQKKYKEIMSDMELKLSELQRKIKDFEVPVVIIFEGWGSSGKGTLINEMILPLDPRLFKVYTIKTPSVEERLHPFLWRYWTKTPAKGRMSIFDRSWYRRVLLERADEVVTQPQLKNAYSEINSFEKQLYDDGNVIIKLFLHISEEEQRKRFKKLESNPNTAWRVTKQDWANNKQYNRYLSYTDEMIQRTTSNHAPWTIIEAHDKNYAAVKIFSTVIEALEKKIAQLETPNEEQKAPLYPMQLEKIDSPILRNIDLSQTISKKDYSDTLKKYQNRMSEIQNELYLKRIPLIIVYEGWDASGKGGNIRRVTQPLHPTSYEVVPIAAPSDIEKAHHYLWRFWNPMPKAGHTTIFDRSWYGRVLVERIEGFCTENEWMRAYEEINSMEEHLVNFGTILIKFWLHIDKAEQKRRFDSRLEDPNKVWKITDEDWRNRDKWDLYEEATDEMLFRTSTPYAPWTIIEGNCKQYARLKALRTIIDTIEKRL